MFSELRDILFRTHCLGGVYCSCSGYSRYTAYCHPRIETVGSSLIYRRTFYCAHKTRNKLMSPDPFFLGGDYRL